MIPQSLGSAATVRVGYYLGRGAYTKGRYASGVAVMTAMLGSVMTALFLVLLREPLTQMYTDDTAVLGIASALILFASAFQLVDAIQCVASYALRGYKVSAIPMMIHIIAFWGCGLIPGYVLAFHYGMGIYGFWAALVVSLGVAAVFLMWYLERHSMKVVKQARLRVIG